MYLANHSYLDTWAYQLSSNNDRYWIWFCTDRASQTYKLPCNTCKLSYIGQTSRSLQQRYKEHTPYIKQNNLQSSYALHILNNKHEYGTIDETMTLLKHINRSTLLLPYEKLYIQTYHHQKELIPEEHINEHNPIYHLIYDLHNTSLCYKSIDK